MTVRIPKWLLWAAAAAAVAGLVAIGFLLGRAGGDGDGGTAASGPREARQAPEAKEAICSRPMAESATLDTEFDDAIRGTALVEGSLEGTEPVEVRFFGDDPIDFQVAILECADLTGDHVAEMVVGLSAGASARIAQWAIFTPDEQGRWTLAFDREMGLISSLEIEGDAVLARYPTYGLDDPLCCPSGSKSVQVESREGVFRIVSPAASPAERLISVDEGRVTGLGSLRPAEATPSQAIAAFGSPTSISNYPSSACRHNWDDLGLSIVFANFGRGDPCGEEGRVATFEAVGSAAEGAGWHTAEDARVGVSAAELERLYPGAKRSGMEMTLVETPSPIGEGGMLAIATAFLVDGEALGYRFYVGAAGE